MWLQLATRPNRDALNVRKQKVIGMMQQSKLNSWAYLFQHMWMWLTWSNVRRDADCEAEVWI